MVLKDTDECLAGHTRPDLVARKKPGKSPRLGIRARKTLLNRATQPVVSSASIWEICVKASIGRLHMADPAETWVPRLESDWGVRALPITFDHSTAVGDLPLHRNDPFGRMLVAQARHEDLALMTALHDR